MGGFAAGFLNTVGDRAQAKVAQQNANEQKLKDEQAQVYWDAIQSGRLSPEQIKYAQEQLQKIYGKSKPLKEIFDKVGKIIGMVHPPKQGQQQPSGGTPPFVAPPPGANPHPGYPTPYVSPNGSVTPSPIPNAKPGDVPAGPSPIPNARPEDKTQVQPLQSTQAVKPPPQFSDFVSAAHPNPEQLEQQKEDSAVRLFSRQEEIKHKNKMEEEEVKAKYAAANSGMKGIPRVLSPVSMSEAKGMAGQGNQFVDAAGNPIDVSAFGDTMQLVPVIQGTRLFYVPTSQHQTHLTVGNVVYGVPALEQTNLATAGVPLGQAKTGTSSTTEQHEFGTARTSTPQTPGVQGAPTRPSSASPQPVPSGTTKKPVGAAGKVNPPAGVVSGVAKEKSGLGGKVYTGAMNTQIARAVPIREAATQVFGDPSQPELKSLRDYAPLVDNPQSRNRIATALNLTFDGLEKAEKTHGSLMTLIQNYGGVPQAIAASKSDVMTDAIGKLTPTEKDFYDSVMSTYGAVIGLRSLTKASAAQFSVKKLEQELPLPGINSMNSRQFYDQLSRLAEQVYNGTRTLPDAVMQQSEKDYYKNQVSNLVDLKNNKPNGKVSPPPGAGSQPKTADELWKQVNQ